MSTIEQAPTNTLRLARAGEMLSRGDVAVVTIGSHRARGRLARALGVTTSDIPYFFSWDREGEWAAIPASRLEEVVKITGIGRARKIADLNSCISFEGGLTAGERLEGLLAAHAG